METEFYSKRLNRQCRVRVESETDSQPQRLTMDSPTINSAQQQRNTDPVRAFLEYPFDTDAVFQVRFLYSEPFRL